MMYSKIDDKILLQLPIFVVTSCLPLQVALVKEGLSMPDIILKKPYNVHQLE